MSRFHGNNKLLNNAKYLRRNMTEQERKLWYLFLRTYPVKFYKQKIIDNYIVDFFCEAAKLVIEIDGTQHYLPNGHGSDIARDKALGERGLLVLRYSNHEINTEFDVVCEDIHNKVTERSF